MRALARHVSHEEEEESAFVSMTDMTVGFLFIIMILLAFFASQFRDQDVVPKDEYDRVVVERDYWLDQSMAYLNKIEFLSIELEGADSERRKLEQAIEDAERKLKELNSEIQQNAQVIADKDKALSERDATINDLRLENKKLLDLAAGLKEELDIKKRKLESLGRDIDEAKRKLDQLTLQIEQQKEAIAHQDKELSDLEIQNNSLRAENKRLLDLIDVLRDQIKEKDLRIEILKAEVIILKSKIQELEAFDPLEEYLAVIAKTRREVLMQLRDAILFDFPDLKVELSEESDALRFQGEGLFASGSSRLTPSKLKIVERLGHRLDEVLPCFTVGNRSTFSETCNPGYVMIEAVQIEGHTDDDGKDRLNRTLSTNRANNTFFAITDAATAVREHLNLKSQPVISIAAYGPDRPVATNDTREGKATNRRIDLRFIMVTPQDTDGIETIRAALNNLRSKDE